LLVVPAMNASAKYTLDDFCARSRLCCARHSLCWSRTPPRPQKSVKELVEALRAKQAAYASAGIGNHGRTSAPRSFWVAPASRPRIFRTRAAGAGPYRSDRRAGVVRERVVDRRDDTRPVRPAACPRCHWRQTGGFACRTSDAGRGRLSRGSDCRDRRPVRTKGRTQGD
jgi:hypothetical protein